MISCVLLASIHLTSPMLEEGIENKVVFRTFLYEIDHQANKIVPQVGMKVIIISDGLEYEGVSNDKGIVSIVVLNADVGDWVTAKVPKSRTPTIKSKEFQLTSDPFDHDDGMNVGPFGYVEEARYTCERVCVPRRFKLVALFLGPCRCKCDCRCRLMNIKVPNNAPSFQNLAQFKKFADTRFVSAK